MTLTEARAIAFRTLMLDSHAAQAVGVLEQHGVPAILLKGRVTANWLYDGESRNYCDVDLLIDPAQRELAMTALAALGYHHHLEGADEFEYGVNEMELVSPAGVVIDLHHTLLGITADPTRCWEVLSSMTTEMVVGGRALPVLDEDARTMHLALHAAQNGPSDIKAIADLERGLRQLPAERWWAAHLISVALDAEEAFSAGLRVTGAGREVATTLGLRPTRDVTLLLRTASAPTESLQIQQFVELDSFGRRMHLVARKIWPSEVYMRARILSPGRGRPALLGARLRRMAGLPRKFQIAFRSWSIARQQAGQDLARPASSGPVGSRWRGAYVLIAGPDGAGKTTVVDAVMARAHSDGAVVYRAHHRPGIVAGKSTDGAPVTDPYAKPPRSMPGALAKVLVVFADYVVAGCLHWRSRRRDGALLVERGWYDMAVDPRRYRLPTAVTPLLRMLGRLLPRPDVALLLTGDADAMHQRKPEIGVAQIERQIGAWRGLWAVAAHHTVEVDTVASPPERAVAVLVAALPGPAWRGVPCTPGRLELRATGRARAGLGIYQPQSAQARVGSLAWRTAGLRGRRVQEPLRGLEELWEIIGIRPDGVASMRSSTAGRLVLSVCVGGQMELVAKVGSRADAALRHEATMLSMQLSPALEILRPRLVWSGPWREHFVMATRAAERSARTPWSVDDVVPLAAALGRAGADGSPLIHGDLTPWNLLRTAEGPVLLDWENARWSDEPLHDLAHFVVQGGALLGRYEPSAAVSLLCDAESPGARLLGERGLGAELARPMLREYLCSAQPTEPRAIEFRAEMLELVRT